MGSGLPTPRATAVKDFEESRASASGQHWSSRFADSGMTSLSSGTFIRQEVGHRTKRRGQNKKVRKEYE